MILANPHLVTWGWHGFPWLSPTGKQALRKQRGNDSSEIHSCTLIFTRIHKYFEHVKKSLFSSCTRFKPFTIWFSRLTNVCRVVLIKWIFISTKCDWCTFVTQSDMDLWYGKVVWYCIIYGDLVCCLAVKKQHSCRRGFIAAAARSWLASADASAQSDRPPGSQLTPRQHLQRPGRARPAHPRLNAPHSQDRESISRPALRRGQEQPHRYAPKPVTTDTCQVGAMVECTRSNNRPVSPQRYSWSISFINDCVVIK